MLFKDCSKGLLSQSVSQSVASAPPPPPSPSRPMGFAVVGGADSDRCRRQCFLGLVKYLMLGVISVVVLKFFALCVSRTAAGVVFRNFGLRVSRSAAAGAFFSQLWASRVPERCRRFGLRVSRSAKARGQVAGLYIDIMFVIHLGIQHVKRYQSEG
jgi:hypothetical protein